MADLNKLETQVAVTEEVTEGTYVAPSAATDYVQPLEDFVGFTPTKELVERNILRPQLGQITPRTGTQRSEAGMAVEMRASGTEGEETDYDLLLETAVGSRRQTTTRTTTKAAPAHTTTTIYIEDADIGDFAVGDGIVVLETGSHEHVVVTAVDSVSADKNITVSPAMSGAPSASVEISKFTTYFGASSGSAAKSLSLTAFLGNGGVSQRIAGMKCTSMSLDNFTTGQIASWNFGLNGLSLTEVLESSPFTPSFDSGVPPLILSACVFQDGTQIDVNNFSLSVTNTLSERLSTCDANGLTALNLTEREISGTFDPYKSDSSTSQFDNFDDNTPYSLIALAATPSSTAGELTLGTCVSIYMPNCITTEFAPQDLNNIIQDGVTFAATAGDSGSDTDIFISVV